MTELSVLSLASYGLISGNGFCRRVLARECEAGTWVLLLGATRAWAGSSWRNDRRKQGAANRRKNPPPSTSVLDSVDYNLHLMVLYSAKYPFHLISITPN